jgi:hypothetical protein
MFGGPVFYSCYRGFPCKLWIITSLCVTWFTNGMFRPFSFSWNSAGPSPREELSVGSCLRQFECVQNSREECFRDTSTRNASWIYAWFLGALLIQQYFNVGDRKETWRTPAYNSMGGRHAVNSNFKFTFQRKGLISKIRWKEMFNLCK